MLCFQSGWSPLLEACANGHLEVASVLLEHHARIDVFDETGKTALHLAAANGHLQLTALLLRYKAFVNRFVQKLVDQNNRVRQVHVSLCLMLGLCLCA